jgi:hypothetical protein
VPDYPVICIDQELKLRESDPLLKEKTELLGGSPSEIFEFGYG